MCIALYVDDMYVCVVCILRYMYAYIQTYMLMHMHENLTCRGPGSRFWIWKLKILLVFLRKLKQKTLHKENSHSKPFLKKTLTANPSSSTSSSSSPYIIIVIHHHRHHRHHRQSRVGCHCHVRRWRATVPLAALGPERPLLLSLPAPLLCSGPPEGTSPGTRWWLWCWWWW